ncbi:MAG: M43 family zinc metalloprotease [Bacteroidia bacterium]
MLKKIISFYIAFSFTGCFISNAQVHRICSTVEHDKYIRSLHPEYAKERDELESKIADYITSHPAQRYSGVTVNIPVVVHIVWDSLHPERNLSDEQIVSQIDVLNEDFNITNANIAEVPSVWANLVGSSRLIFSLARKDENGNPTNGITRRKSPVTSFSLSDAVKFDSSGGSNAWDNNHFLNIWVCNLESGSSAILGYAQYPSNVSPETDGIVINYQAFGRTGTDLKDQYNLGRTATHEIGHWLNLVHIWGDDDACSLSDHINDTPNQGEATYGCPSSPHASCNNSPNGDMFQNYMDYTDDKCMMFFTTDQRARMNAAFTMYRDTLRYAELYTMNDIPMPNDLKITAIDSPAGLICNKYMLPGVKIQNAGSNTVTSFTLGYRIDDDTMMYQEWTGSLLPSESTELVLSKTLIPEDLHVFTTQITEVNGGSDDFTLDNFRTSSFLYAPSRYSCPVYPEIPEIKIEPNLTNNGIIIETKYKEAQKATLSIYNILGDRIYSRDYLESHGQTVSVDVNGFASGMYFVEIKTFDKQVSQRFVVYH